MNIGTSKIRFCRDLSLLALGLVGLAGAASAQQMINEGMGPTDPVMQMARWYEPRDEFHLYSGTDVELIRFKEPHLLAICNSRADPAAVGDAKHAYPLLISFDGDTSTVEPGNCFVFDAQRVKVRPATSLPQNVVLSGTVRIIK